MTDSPNHTEENTIGIVLKRLLPSPLPVPPWLQTSLAMVLVGISIIVVAWSLMHFRKSKTTLDVRKPASTLITDGVFRYSRNPIYVSLTLLYLGIGLLTNNLWIIVLVVPCIIVMNRSVIVKEERFLDAKFGAAYQQYQASVRRWI